MGRLGHALLVGTLLALAFPPFGLAPLAWLALVPLLLVIARRPRGAFRLGFAAGAAFRLISMPWVAALLQDHGGAPRSVAAGAYLLLSAYLAIYTGVFAVSLRRAIASLGPPALLLAPFLWAALEWANASLLTGFHWNPLSASQAGVLPLAGAVRAAGAPGLSFLIVLVNALIAYPFARRGAGRGVAGRRRRRTIFAGGALLALVPLAGLAIPAAPDRAGAGGVRLHLRLVTPAVPQSAKWTLGFRREALSRLAALSRAGPRAPDIVLWPEAALPFPFDANPSGAETVRRLARAIGAGVLFGSPGRTPPGAGSTLTNSAFLVDREGNLAGRYDKRRRVPFGEYVPLRPLLPFLPAVATGLARGDLAAGGAAAVFRTEKARLGPLICYEAIFGDLAAETAGAGAGVLVNLTNDAWLGRAGGAQHFAMARWRAVERGLPLVRVANGGTSAVIEPDGRARCVLGGEAAASADCTLRLRTGPPATRPFQRFFPPCCALLSLAALLGGGDLRRHVRPAARPGL